MTVMALVTETCAVATLADGEAETLPAVAVESAVAVTPLVSLDAVKAVSEPAVGRALFAAVAIAASCVFTDCSALR